MNMKKAMVFIVVMLISLSVCSCTLADYGIFGDVIKEILKEEEFSIRGYLKWGMNESDVYNGLNNEKKDDQSMCLGVENTRSSSNGTISVINANTYLGEYKAFIQCSVSDLWGLYFVHYLFNYSYTLTNKDLLNTYNTVEKTLNYLYGFGERIIDKYDTINELEDNYYIMRTKWVKGSTEIYLQSYKTTIDGTRYNLMTLDYNSPNYNDYIKILEQDLVVSDKNMFYGY